MLSSTSVSLVGALQFAQSNVGKWKNQITKALAETDLTQSKKELVQDSSQARSSTTDALTATILIYAIGAGITAAAGTRLALQ